MQDLISSTCANHYFYIHHIARSRIVSQHVGGDSIQRMRRKWRG